MSIRIQTARGGRSTVVVDADDAGYGCSSRNGGQIGWSIKPSYKELAARHGSEKALAILREGDNALEWIGGFVNSDTDFTQHPQVINGCSDLMVDVFGDKGKHARFALGAGSLPLNVAVEIDAVVEIE